MINYDKIKPKEKNKLRHLCKCHCTNNIFNSFQIALSLLRMEYIPEKISQIANKNLKIIVKIKIAQKGTKYYVGYIFFHYCTNLRAL